MFRRPPLIFSFVTGVISLVLFFIIVPWLLLLMGLIGIIIFVATCLGLRNAKTTVTYINLTNMAPRARQRENSSLKDDMTITVHPDGSISEAAPPDQKEAAIIVVDDNNTQGHNPK